MAADAGEDETLEFTPTWIVALVCFVIVLVSLLAERSLHYLGKTFRRKKQKPLYEAVLKVKEELMILGFISLLLTACQGHIQKICIPPGLRLHMLPCKRRYEDEVASTKENLVAAQIIGRIGRRLLSKGTTGPGICKGSVQLMSLESMHELHIFIFVLAITHVVFSVLTMLLGGAKIHQWKVWEDAIQKDTEGNGPKQVTFVHNFTFIREHYKGIGKDSTILSWLHSFFKQFYASVNKTDYTTLRLGFIMTHCRGNLKFNFHKYMLRVLESDFKKVVGISWYLWVFMVLFLLLNVNGWDTYFWIAFLPLIITYGFNSCILGKAGLIVTRLVIGFIIQLLCSYCTLPLYAIVTQMGSFYKKEIFNDHVQKGVLGWAQKAKMKKGFGNSNDTEESTSTVESARPSAKIEMMKRAAREVNDACESIEECNISSE